MFDIGPTVPKIFLLINFFEFAQNQKKSVKLRKIGTISQAGTFLFGTGRNLCVVFIFDNYSKSLYGLKFISSDRTIRFINRNLKSPFGLLLLFSRRVNLRSMFSHTKTNYVIIYSKCVSVYGFYTHA